MCTPSPDELVTMREFLACKDPRDSTKTHTFSYLLDDENHKVAEEILDTSVSSPLEMIRSLTQEQNSAGNNQLDAKFSRAIPGTGKPQGPLPEATDHRRAAASLKPSAVFVPRFTEGSSMRGFRSNDAPNHLRRAVQPEASKTQPESLPSESSLRSYLLEAQFIRRLTSMARNQLEATANPQHSPRPVVECIQQAKKPQQKMQHLIMKSKASDERNGSAAREWSSTAFPIVGTAPAPISHQEHQSGENSASPMGIKLLKVFENDEYITFRKVYPAAMKAGSLQLAGMRDQSAGPKQSEDAESRGQSEAGRASYRREARVDPPDSVEMEEHADVISEETKLSSSGARQVLIVVSSKNQPSGKARKR